jgi:hypothetical protein
MNTTTSTFTPQPYKRKPNFNNTNHLTGKSFCVYCLKGLPPIKKDALYSTKSKKWNRQFHKGGSCAETREFRMMCDHQKYYDTLKENKELITRAINNNKTPAQQKKLDDKAKQVKK